MNSLAIALGISTPEQESFTDKLTSKIQSYFNDLNENRLIFVACFSGLLARVVCADKKIDQKEIEGMSKILEELSQLDYKNTYQLSRLAIEEMVELNIFENCQYCKALNSILNDEQKKVVLNALCLIAISDKDLADEEILEIENISNALGLNPLELQDSLEKARALIENCP